MSDIISRQGAVDAIMGEPTDAHYPSWYADRIKSLPSTEPKTGEWVLKEHLWECDQCGCRINRANPLKGNVWNYNFCPNCGAKMKGADDEREDIQSTDE